jgi:hypothetical protein
MRTIVWDVDDVLNDLMLAWFNETWMPAHPECRLSYSGIKENPPDRVLGISRTEYLSSLDEFRLSQRARSLRPNAAVLAWLQQSGAAYRHVALTARPIGCSAPAAEWLFRHFGSYIRTFSVVPSRLAPGEPAYDTTKEDFLRWFGRADILVDDSEENIRSAEKLGIRGVLYPQPWNRCSLSVDDTLESLTRLAAAH